MVAEAGHDIEIGTEFQLVEKCVAVAVEVVARSEKFPDADTIDEPERGEKIPAQLLEDEIAAPRFVGQIQREGGGLIIAERVGRAAFIEPFRFENVAAEKI